MFNKFASIILRGSGEGLFILIPYAYDPCTIPLPMTDHCRKNRDQQVCINRRLYVATVHQRSGGIWALKVPHWY